MNLPIVKAFFHEVIQRIRITHENGLILSVAINAFGWTGATSIPLRGSHTIIQRLPSIMFMGMIRTAIRFL